MSKHTSVLWNNLPSEIDAATIARLYRQRWRIEGIFQRLESVLHSEIKILSHPRAALLGFAVVVLASVPTVDINPRAMTTTYATGGTWTPVST